MTNQTNKESFKDKILNSAAAKVVSVVLGICAIAFTFYNSTTITLAERGPIIKGNSEQIKTNTTKIDLLDKKSNDTAINTQKINYLNLQVFEVKEEVKDLVKEQKEIVKNQQEIKLLLETIRNNQH